MKEAIQKAIEGGYVAEPFYAQDTYAGLHERNRILLDPLFWQALGNTMGWKSMGVSKACLCGTKSMEVMEWHMRWYCFIDTLIEGKDTESFFKELLGNSEQLK